MAVFLALVLGVLAPRGPLPADAGDVPANVHAARMPDPPMSMTSRLDVRTAEEVVYLAAAVVVAVSGG
jgi:hypothetical protein